MRVMQKVDIRGQYAKTHGYTMKSLKVFLLISRKRILLAKASGKYVNLTSCFPTAAAAGGVVVYSSSQRMSKEV